MIEQADAVIVPSRFARERLRELGAPLPWERVAVLAPPVHPHAARRPSSGERGDYALVVSRLSPEKGVDVAIDACRIAGRPLVVAGEGPQLHELRARAEGSEVRFEGRVDERRLAELRAGAALALVPSRSAETFGMAAAESMAVGLPVLASRVGAIPELVDERSLVEPGDPKALAAAMERVAGDGDAGERARRRVVELCAPEIVAEGLRQIYDGPAALSGGVPFPGVDPPGDPA